MSRPLGHAGVQREGEVVVQLPDSDAVDRPHDAQTEHCAERAEPIRLIVCGCDRELQRIALLVPHPAVVACDYAEAVGPRRQVGILSLTVIHHLSPVGILPLQLVLEMNLVRRGEAESGVVDLQIASSRRQTHARTCRARQVLPIHLVVGYDLLDVDRRRELIEGKMMGIDHLDAFPYQ